MLYVYIYIYTRALYRTQKVLRDITVYSDPSPDAMRLKGFSLQGVIDLFRDASLGKSYQLIQSQQYLSTKQQSYNLNLPKPLLPTVASSK